MGCVYNSFQLFHCFGVEQCAVFVATCLALVVKQVLIMFCVENAVEIKEYYFFVHGVGVYLRTVFIFCRVRHIGKTVGT